MYEDRCCGAPIWMTVLGKLNFEGLASLIRAMHGGRYWLRHVPVLMAVMADREVPYVACVSTSW